MRSHKLTILLSSICLAFSGISGFFTGLGISRLPTMGGIVLIILGLLFGVIFTAMMTMLHVLEDAYKEESSVVVIQHRDQ